MAMPLFFHDEGPRGLELALVMTGRECYHCKQWLEPGEAHVYSRQGTNFWLHRITPSIAKYLAVNRGLFFKASYLRRF